MSMKIEKLERTCEELMEIAKELEAMNETLLAARVLDSMIAVTRKKNELQ
jgi:hypothetical protein